MRIRNYTDKRAGSHLTGTSSHLAVVSSVALRETCESHYISPMPFPSIIHSSPIPRRTKLRAAESRLDRLLDATLRGFALRLPEDRRGASDAVSPRPAVAQ